MGYKVYFTTVASLINELKESRSEKKLYTFEKKFEKYNLIVADELMQLYHLIPTLQRF